MSAHAAKRRWSMSSSSSGSDSEPSPSFKIAAMPSGSDAFPNPSTKFALCIFFNVQLDTKGCKQRDNDLGIISKLGLNRDAWKCVDFANCHFVDAAEGGVTLDYTVNHFDKLASVVSVTFVLVEKRNLQCGNKVHFCMPDKKKQKLLPLFCFICRLCRQPSFVKRHQRWRQGWFA